jgi:vitellogenic carboxypeptidase-like protein
MMVRSLWHLFVAAAASAVAVAIPAAEHPLGNTTYISGTGGDEFLFYYFPASNASSAAAPTPVVLWLQGGPGCAATMGLFSEMGPSKMDGAGVQTPRATAWNLHGMDLLTVDSPAGTGYSYNTGGMLRATVDEAMQSLLVALQTAVTHWQPQLHGRPLFIAGESFAGRWVPSLAAAILRDADARSPCDRSSTALNLAGVATGSGWTAPVDQAQCVPTFAYHAGMLGPVQRDEYAALVGEMKAAAVAGDWARAGAAWDNVTDGMFVDAGMPDPSDFRTYGFSSFAVFDAITT